MYPKNEAGSMVSVLLPVYNGARYVGRAVESVLSQGYKNFELLVLNDGSTDDTERAVSRFRSDKRVRIISRENRGLVATLNEGVQLCRGTYVMRMDADDLCLPDRMEKQLRFLQENNLDLVGSAIRTFGRRLGRKQIYPASPEAVKVSLLFTSCFAHPAVLARRTVFSQNPYNEAYNKIEDYELWTRLALQGYRMGNCPEVLLRYRVHAAQVSSANRQHQDRMRVGIARQYAAGFFGTPEYGDVIKLLLNREFVRLSAEEVEDLNKFYSFLCQQFPAQQEAIHYQFFLCFLHNRFCKEESIRYLNDASLFRKALIRSFNHDATKRIPAKVYRLIC